MILLRGFYGCSIKIDGTTVRTAISCARYQLPEHVRRAAMEASSDDDSDEDGEEKGKFSAGWGKNRWNFHCYICIYTFVVLFIYLASHDKADSYA